MSLFRPMMVLCVLTVASGLSAQPNLPPSEQALDQAPLVEEPNEAKVLTEAEKQAANQTRRAKVYAEYDGKTLTVGALEDEIASQPLAIRRQLKTSPARLAEFAQGLVRREVMFKEAERRGLAQNSMVQKIVREGAVQALMAAETPTVNPLQIDELKAYYDAHLDRFHQPEARRASHILLATEAEAVALREKLGDADIGFFRKNARDLSIDKETKMRGGDLRFFDAKGQQTRGRKGHPVANELATAAFSLKEIGEISTPIAVGKHFSLLMLTGKMAAQKTSFEVARGRIEIALHHQKQQARLDALTTQIRQRQQPKVRPELIEKIVLETELPAPGFKAIQEATPKSKLDQHGHSPSHGSRPTAARPKDDEAHK